MTKVMDITETRAAAQLRESKRSRENLQAVRSPCPLERSTGKKLTQDAGAVDRLFQGRSIGYDTVN